MRCRLVNLNSLMDGLPPLLNTERITLGQRKVERLRDPMAKQVGRAAQPAARIAARVYPYTPTVHDPPHRGVWIVARGAWRVARGAWRRP